MLKWILSLYLKCFGHHVDDYASGADSVDSAFCPFERLKKVFQEVDST